MTAQSKPQYGECPTCRRRTIPVLDLLPCGHEAEAIVQTLDTEGVVYAWTRTTGSGGSAPTVLAMVDFLDGTLRASAPVLGVASLEIGDRVLARHGEETPLAFELHRGGGR